MTKHHSTAGEVLGDSYVVYSTVVSRAVDLEVIPCHHGGDCTYVAGGMPARYHKDTVHTGPTFAPSYSWMTSGVC